MSTKGDQFRRVSGGLILLLIGTIVGVTLVSEFHLLPVGQAVNDPAKEKSAEILPSDSQIFVSISKAVTPAVVNISTTRIIKDNSEQGGLPFNDPLFRRFFGEGGEPFQHRRGAPQQRKEQSLGSGVIVSSDGLIVTNNHVVEEADEIKVLLEDKREFKGTVVGKDKKSDIAVIRIEATHLPTVPWSNSDNLQVGEYVVAVGNPFGLNQTVTMGIVSAIGRANVGIADYEDFIQTDAAINPGNSGGALVNIRGELIGINTAIFTRSGGYMGVGFAVPSNMVRSVMDSLVKTGRVTRGWLGVSIQDITPALAKEFGLKDSKGSLVTDIMPDSPAAKADLKRGDVIFSFTGHEIENSSHLRNMVARTGVGTKALVKIIRDKKEKEISVTLSEQPKEVAEKGEEKEAESGSFGISVQDVTPDMAEQFNLDPKEKGVIVVQIEEGSLAEEAGLREGDLIIEINRKPVLDLKSYERLFTKIKKGEAVLILINRQGSRFYLTLTKDMG
ncbi:MAG: DegQ family serine endoprotease [Nitrospirae bacterium]|nr:DegQ family serine endoprotease [Candidatus Troglogloeales bacterium]